MIDADQRLPTSPISATPSPEDSSRAARIATDRRIDGLVVGQTLLGIAALLISGAALWTSFVQADATQKMQEASVLPAIQLDFTIDVADGVTNGAVRVENVGVGPATMRRWALTVNEQPMSVAALESALPEGMTVTGFSQSSMQNRLLAPGASFTPMETFLSGDSDASKEAFLGAGSGGSNALVEAIVSRDLRIVMELCYCSVFDRCWTATQEVGKMNSQAIIDPECAMRYKSAPSVP